MQMHLSLFSMNQVYRFMVISLVEGLIWLLNAFPLSNAVSDTISPVTIVLCRQNIDLNQKRVTFRSYVMVYIGTKNTMKRKSIPSVVLNESNKWGGYNFLPL